MGDRAIVVIDVELTGSTITWISALESRTERFTCEEHMPVLNALWDLMDTREIARGRKPRPR